MKRLAFLISVVVILTCGMNADVVAKPKAAIVSADAYSTGVPISDLFDTGLFDPVDENTDIEWIDVGWTTGETPTLTDLANFDSLLVYSSQPFLDRVSLSNVLKSYVVGGGHVVLAAYSFTDDNYLDYAIGKTGVNDGIVYDGYSPFKPVAATAGPPTTSDSVRIVLDDPIFDDITHDANGVLVDFGYYNQSGFLNNPTLDTTGGADLLADDGNGVNMIARNVAGNVVALNFCPSVNTYNSGQFYQLVANAMQPVPEPATSIIWVLLGFGLMVAIRTRT